MKQLIKPQRAVRYSILIMAWLAILACNNNKTQHISSVNNNPEPIGWYAGDIHTHRSCNSSLAISDTSLLTRMGVNDLAVISLLSDMGNSQAPDRVADLQKVDGNDSPLSGNGKIIHYAAEWHWDANDFEKPHQALGGHLVLLGIKKAYKIWDESAYKILEWAKPQKAVCGFAHMQYLDNNMPNTLSCCIPVEFPVEAILGTIDFVSEDCAGGDVAINAWYKLLNCGIKMGLAAGTDYPCNGGDPYGTLLTYVNIKDNKLTYQNWIDGIKNGHTVVSRNCHNEFLNLSVNNKFTCGDEVHISNPQTFNINVEWTAKIRLTGRVEVVCNGNVIAKQEGTAKPGEPIILKATQEFTKSGWLCARRMDKNGHQTHTAPVYVIVNNAPVRASADDAMYFVQWIDNLIAKTSPGQDWNKYFTHDLDVVQGRYKQAREMYLKVAEEADLHATH